MDNFKTDYTPLCNVPAPDSNQIEFFDCSDGYFMAIAYQQTEKKFNQYVSILNQNGYETIFKKQWGDTAFCRLKNSDSAVTLMVSLVEHSGEMRIIASDCSLDLPVQNSFNPICSSLMIQLETNAGIEKLDEGLCFIFRLQDSRFIIVDGGYRRGVFAKRIYDTLKRYAINPNCIRIASWIFSHAHIDHVGAFYDFAEMYHDDPTIKIENFSYHFSVNEELCRYIDNSCAPRVKELIGHYYPDVPVYKHLAGETHYYANVKIDYLYTIADFLPMMIPNEPDATEKIPKRGDGNKLSSVFRVDFGDKSVMMLTDTTTYTCNELCARYGKEMKSDYVQMAHHGLCPVGDVVSRRQNGTIEIYDMIGAEYAFLPCSTERAKVRLEYDVNRHVAQHVKKIFVSGDGDTVIDFKDI